MTKYSGRTTAHRHKFDDWAEQPTENIRPAISQVTVFNAQWTDCPVEVEAEVKQLWRDQELRNDNCYFKWDRDDETCIPVEGDDGEEDWKDVKLSECYPLIDEYLMSKGVEKCLIHWWW